MLSAGAAFLLAYLPSRHVAWLLRGQALERRGTPSDQALRHAVEFARRALPIEHHLTEKTLAQLTSVATTAGVVLPAAPHHAEAVDAWLGGIEAAVRPLLDAPVLEVAWSAGATARSILAEALMLAQLAYLRGSAPADEDLRAEAVAHAEVLEAATRAFGPLLARTELPLVVRLVDSISRVVGAVPELTPTDVRGYRALNELVGGLTMRFEAIARELDVPPPRRASAPPTPEEDALLAKVVADPYDDGARLALGKLAGLRGDPRAEMITVQFAERAATSPERPSAATPHRVRARELSLSYPEWSEPLAALGARDVKFWRGFPDEITIDAETLLARGRELYAQAPLTKLHVRRAAGRVRDIVTSPLLAQIETLDLAEQGVTDDDIVALAGSPHLGKLRHLVLSGNQITERGVEAIAGAPRLRGLVSIRLDGNPADPVDSLEYYDETHQHYVRTASGKALEAKYGPLRWLHPDAPV